MRRDAHDALSPPPLRFRFFFAATPPSVPLPRDGGAFAIFFFTLSGLGPLAFGFLYRTFVRTPLAPRTTSS